MGFWGGGGAGEGLYSRLCVLATNNKINRKTDSV